MNRTAATCIAGMRSKTTSGSRIHFFPRPREAKPFTRFTRRFLAFGLGIPRQETAVATRAQPVEVTEEFVGAVDEVNDHSPSG